MGKATKWFKGLFGTTKKGKECHVENISYSSERIRRNAEDTWFYDADEEKEQNKHAIAVAAATAAAADAAVAAAQAAVAVVRLTSQGRGGLFNGGKGKLAAIKIQAVFRGFLARKARRALRGLVKLQALVRGYLVRKRAAATMRSMQALFRAQTAVRSQRARRAGNNRSLKCRQDAGPRKSLESFDENMSMYTSNRLSVASYDHSVNAFNESPKIVEIDTFGTKTRSRRVNSSILDYGERYPCPYSSHLSIQNHHHVQDFDWALVEHDSKYATAHNTPRLPCLDRANVPGSPASSVYADGFYAAYANSPSYMANTQSFKAKLRSHSAPKQRPEIVMGPKKKLPLPEIMASRTSFSGARMQRCSQVHEDYEC